MPGQSFHDPRTYGADYRERERIKKKRDRWVKRFAGHAVSPEKAADKILAGVAKNRYLIYTSVDIRALYAFKRLAWWPYSVAMRQVNVIFTRALRPAPVPSTGHGQLEAHPEQPDRAVEVE